MYHHDLYIGNSNLLSGLQLPSPHPTVNLHQLHHWPVRVWKQCSLKTSVSSISIPELPTSGDNCEPMANNLGGKQQQRADQLVYWQMAEDIALHCSAWDRRSLSVQLRMGLTNETSKPTWVFHWNSDERVQTEWTLDSLRSLSSIQWCPCLLRWTCHSHPLHWWTAMHGPLHKYSDSNGSNISSNNNWNLKYIWYVDEKHLSCELDSTEIVRFFCNTFGMGVSLGGGGGM